VSYKPKSEHLKGPHGKGPSQERVVQMPSQGPTDTLHRLRALQQTLGNQGVLARLQPKLAVNRPGDVYEQEADRVAEAVMSQATPAMPPAQSVSHAQAPAPVQRKCATCAEEDEELAVQRKESAPGYAAGAAPVVEQALSSPGQPLDAGTRSFMERRFGQNFGDVRIHTDAQTANSAHALHATAYTVGRDVFFFVGPL
jgi:hypothetical protein